MSLMPHNRQTTTARRGGEAGFTLIELLVVVIILGILSAVVVFAVRGADDKGDTAARATDERILRTALETFCATRGHYPGPADPGWNEGGAMNVLVRERYLSDHSRYHGIETVEPPAGFVSPQGNCPGPGPNRYQITPDPTEVDDDTPPACTDLLGCLEEVTRPPLHDHGQGQVMLPSGKLMSWAWDDTVQDDWLNDPGSLQLYDPLIDDWEKLLHPPCLTGSPPACDGEWITHAIPLMGAFPVCEENCGKILMRIKPSKCGYAATRGLNCPSSRWAVYDPNTTPQNAVPISSPVYSPYYGMSVNLLWSAECDGGSAPSWCGKILATGGIDQYLGGFTEGPHPPTSQLAHLYDPKSNEWIPTTPMNHPRAHHLSTVLRDGRVLVVGRNPPERGVDPDGVPGVLSAEIYDPRNGSWTLTTGAPSARHFWTDFFGKGRGEDTTAGSALLPDGRVILGGNSDGPVGRFEIFDPAGGGSFTLVDEPEYQPEFDKPPLRGGDSSLTALADGRVMLINSVYHDYQFWSYEVRVYDPSNPSDPWADGTRLPDAGPGALITGTTQTCGDNCNKVLIMSKGLNAPDTINKKKAWLWAPPPRP